MFLAAHLMYNTPPNQISYPPTTSKRYYSIVIYPCFKQKKEHNAVATQETFNLFWWKNIAAISRILRRMLKNDVNWE